MELGKVANKHGGIALLHFVIDFNKEDKDDGGEDETMAKKMMVTTMILTTATLDLWV